MSSAEGHAWIHGARLVIGMTLLMGVAAADKTLLAQDAPADPPPTPAPATATEEMSNKDLFSDFLHNAVLGKFQRADAYAQRLLANNPDPLEVLEFADQHTNSLKTLILLVNNIEVSDSAKKVLELIHEGELLRRQDPQRIKENIAKLGGDPQTEFNAINRLRDSGEYAVPWLVDTLRDDGRSKLHSRLIRMLPKLGKQAVNPLVIALSMEDNKTRQFIVRALGEIGYPQAMPYLLAVLDDAQATPELKQHVEKAISQILSSSPSVGIVSADQSFLDLARQYYEEHGSVKPDPRSDSSNVWYWRDGRLERSEVPRVIFDEIMTMRCCERTLQLNAQADSAIGLWLAANIRREAELGMNVESAEADAAAAADPTKIANFPRSAYFARAAGARYCHMVLDLANEHREPAVALGAITALRLVAGATNLVGDSGDTQPLAQALTFPDQVVRIKAALALAHALPTEPFADSDRVVPILNQALAQTGKKGVLVIDPDGQNLNRVMAILRNDDTTVLGEAQVYDGLERARNELPGVAAIFLATNVSEPSLDMAVTQIRDNNALALAPLILLTRQEQADAANTIAKGDDGVATVAATAEAAQLLKTWNTVEVQTGQQSLNKDEALTLALDAAEALRKIAFSHSTVYDFNLAENALTNALISSKDEVLQVSSASVLALSASSNAQRAIAEIAVNPNNTESLRIAAFASLSESAKVNGNILPEDVIDALIELAMHEPNLTLRSAASQALGALNLPSNKAEQIIQEYYRG